MNQFEFPEHNCELNLVHNSHKNSYETVEQYLEVHSCGDWINEEQRMKAFVEQDYWELHWYPDTPVTFICLYAHDLNVLLEHAWNYSHEEKS